MQFGCEAPSRAPNDQVEPLTKHPRRCEATAPTLGPIRRRTWRASRTRGQQSGPRRRPGSARRRRWLLESPARRHPSRRRRSAHTGGRTRWGRQSAAAIGCVNHRLPVEACRRSGGRHRHDEQMRQSLASGSTSPAANDRRSWPATSKVKCPPSCTCRTRAGGVAVSCGRSGGVGQSQPNHGPMAASMIPNPSPPRLLSGPNCSKTIESTNVSPSVSAACCAALGSPSMTILSCRPNPTPGRPRSAAPTQGMEHSAGMNTFPRPERSAHETSWLAGPFVVRPVSASSQSASPGMLNGG